MLSGFVEPLIGLEYRLLVLYIGVVGGSEVLYKVEVEVVAEVV